MKILGTSARTSVSFNSQHRSNKQNLENRPNLGNTQLLAKNQSPVSFGDIRSTIYCAICDTVEAMLPSNEQFIRKSYKRALTNFGATRADDLLYEVKHGNWKPSEEQIKEIRSTVLNASQHRSKGSFKEMFEFLDIPINS